MDQTDQKVQHGCISLFGKGNVPRLAFIYPVLLVAQLTFGSFPQQHEHLGAYPDSKYLLTGVSELHSALSTSLDTNTGLNTILSARI